MLVSQVALGECKVGGAVGGAVLGVGVGVWLEQQTISVVVTCIHCVVFKTCHMSKWPFGTM